MGRTHCPYGVLSHHFYVSQYDSLHVDEYTIFLDEFQKNPNATWIVKPNNKSQGYGIFLLKKINQLKKIVPGANLNGAFKNINTN